MRKTVTLFVMCCSFALCSLAFAAPSNKAKQKKGVAYWHKALKHKDKKVRTKAAKALAALGPKAFLATSTLIQTLADEDFFVSYHAKEALGSIGTKSFPLLLRALQDKKRKTKIRYEIADLIGQLGPKAASAVPILLTLLKGKNADLALGAAKALGGIGPKAIPALPTLITALKGKSTSLASSAAVALGKIGPKAASAVPDLITALKHKNSDVRKGAAQGLGGIGPKAAPATTYLAKALSDLNADVCKHAAISLGQIGPKASKAVPALLRTLKKGYSNAQRASAVALGKIGTHLEQVVPTLIAVLQNKKEYRDTRGYAAKGLGFLGQKAAKKTIPVLVAALASSHIPVYYESAVALGKIGGMAVPALRPVFFGNNSSHRAGAARALGFIGKPAIPMLLEGLKHKKWGIRWRSAMALGRMGTQARPAIPALRKAQKDKTLLVSKAATKAIKSISGK